MHKSIKRLLAFVIAICILSSAAITAYAEDDGEEYVCELRLIYAEDYSEAMDILEDSEFSDYELLDENLNSNTGEIGVWLAYKTTDDIEDAITDVAVMQMGGGYREGNYQEMIKKSRDEYVEMGELYLDAIDYWKTAYKANNFLANSAYRQLNFYTGVDGYKDVKLGDVLLKGIKASELATVFFEGNFYALKNIRSLIAMGVSYNSDGKTYLQKVGDEAKKLASNPSLYAGSDLYELSKAISPEIAVFKEMFEELAVYEPELDYEDDEITDRELEYLEYKAIAELFRDVDYTGGKTLYDFCLTYNAEDDDLSVLHPLAAALNKGQVAMTVVHHYYDVVRYSVPICAEKTITEEIDKLEDTYGEKPFDIYTGVDRSIYDGTFALTSAAYRAEAYTESGLFETLFGGENAYHNKLAVGYGAVGVALFAAAVYRRSVVMNQFALKVQNLTIAYNKQIIDIGNTFANNIMNTTSGVKMTAVDFVDDLLTTYLPNAKTASMTFTGKLGLMSDNANLISSANPDKYLLLGLQKNVTTAQGAVVKPALATPSMGGLTGGLFVVGGALMLYTAISLGKSIYNYYHPEYDDIPNSMVDLIDTVDGDRYIKYDVVCEVEAQQNDSYAAADLNAFEGQRWNALYYTKSYEAGKPLLADFNVEYDNNVPSDGYAPVRRFGEVVCYDLNKYNYDSDSDSIYLSIAQSEKQKSAVADVPEVVGSMFNGGRLLLAGGIGLISGAGATLGVQTVFRKKKKSAA